MKEKIGVVLASAVLVSGCNQNVVQELEAPETPQVQLDALPDTLPAAVAVQIPNVVAITDTLTIAKTAFGDIGSGEFCSGVRIDQYDYLSAGHCDFQLETPADAAYCESFAISSPSSDSADGESLTVSKKTGVFNSTPNGVSDVTINNQEEDALLLHAVSEPQPYTVPTHLADPASFITPGAPLYLVNYEPTADNQLRSPYTPDLRASELQAGLNKPAVFGAVALKQFDNGLIIGATTDTPYSNPPETEVRQGASGGPVYDKDGNLVGTSIDILQSSDPQQIEQSLHVTITDVPPTGLHLFMMQSITPRLITDLQSEETSLPRC